MKANFWLKDRENVTELVFDIIAIAAMVYLATSLIMHFIFGINYPAVFGNMIAVLFNFILYIGAVFAIIDILSHYMCKKIARKVNTYFPDKYNNIAAGVLMERSAQEISDLVSGKISPDKFISTSIPGMREVYRIDRLCFEQYYDDVKGLK